MKKLTKLQINPEKLMKNSELLTLRGGYGDDDGTCGYHCWANYNPSYQSLECNKSYVYVQDMIRTYKSYDWSCNWCCDSCSSTTYCG